MQKKKGPPAKAAAHKVWRFYTSRGEQLMQRHWEETAMRIN
jgi:hypothetical protein